jgi:hypothetical protein
MPKYFFQMSREGEREAERERGRERERERGSKQTGRNKHKIR